MCKSRSRNGLENGEEGRVQDATRGLAWWCENNKGEPYAPRSSCIQYKTDVQKRAPMQPNHSSAAVQQCSSESGQTTSSVTAKQSPNQSAGEVMDCLVREEAHTCGEQRNSICTAQKALPAAVGITHPHASVGSLPNRPNRAERMLPCCSPT